MELPIAHIFQGEKGGPVKEKLNKVIDIINSLGDDVSMNTGLLSNYVYFRKNDDNPSTPDVDILLYAYYGTLRWKVSGEIYQINLMSEGYEGTSGLNITLDAFDGEEGESRIDTIYAIAPPNLSDYTTGIKVRKGENSEYPTAPGINTATEVLLGYAYVGVGGFSEGSGTGTGNVETLQYKFDHHSHIVTQAESEGGNFTFEVPNVIAKNMGIHVYCNQLPLTLNKGYSVDLESETSKEVTILKNNSDETYFAIKTGWPIFVGYYYKVAVPGTPENPPEPLSNVTLVSVTHQSPDDPEAEYNAANDVKFILHFSNTGSAAESLNLLLPLTHSSGGTYASQSITHSVPPGGNTYEITYRGLGNTDGPNTYTQSVLGDRQSSDSVTVPAKTASFTGAILGCNRQTTDTLSTAIRITNTSSIVGTKTVYIQLDSGTKIPITGTVYGGQYDNYFYTWNSVSSAAHTVTLYDTNQTTVLDTWEVAALSGTPGGTPVITTALNTYVKATGYTAAGNFKFNGAWEQSIDWAALELGVGGSYVDAINRSQVKILDVPNIASLSTVVLRFIPISGYEPSNTNFAALQVHVHNKDLRVSQTYYDYHYNYINNNIVLSTQIIPNSDIGDTEYRVTLDGNYFENIADGYKGLLFKFTDETTPNTWTYLRLRQVQYIP